MYTMIINILRIFFCSYRIKKANPQITIGSAR